MLCVSWSFPWNYALTRRLRLLYHLVLVLGHHVVHRVLNSLHLIVPLRRVSFFFFSFLRLLPFFSPFVDFTTSASSCASAPACPGSSLGGSHLILGGVGGGGGLRLYSIRVRFRRRLGVGAGAGLRLTGLSLPGVRLVTWTIP
jgi:hypothetical protein